MKLEKAERMALKLINKHVPHVSFAFDNAARRFGCYHRKGDVCRITISRRLCKLNKESIVKNTILHEIAHALAPRGAGHGVFWIAMAEELGCSTEKCYRTSEVKLPKLKYTATCPNCKKSVQKNKDNGSACYACCKTYNDNKYTDIFKFKYKLNVR